MTNSRVVQLLFLISSMMSQVIGMVPQEVSPKPPQRVSSMPFQVKGIAQRIAEELPKELRYDILSSALALRENPQYEVYKKLDVGSQVRGIALSGDNTRALTGSSDGIARIWDVEKGKVLIELKEHAEAITSVALSAAGGTIALTGSWDGTARVWNMNTGELIQTLQVGSRVNSMALSADGALALTGSRNNIRLYSTLTGELLKELEGHRGGISSVALSADGKIAFTGSYDGTARVWDTNTGKTIKNLRVGHSIASVALSADGTSALTRTDNNKVLVWDAQSGALLNTLLTNSPSILSVALSKDGKRALVATGDGKIQVWNTKPLPGQEESNTPLTVLAGHTQPVKTVAFGGADFIASGSDDNTALIWKPFAFEPRGPQEHEKLLSQAYKETFSRPLLRSTNGN